MKKNDCHATGISMRYVKKMVITMKLAFILLLSTFQAIAINSSSQARINLDLKNVPISNVISIIETNYKYRFVYTNILGLDKRNVDIVAKNATIDYVVQKLLSNTEYSYKKINKGLVVIIKNQDVTETLPIKGKVLDNNRNPVAQVTVIEKGTNNGVTTAEDGSFNITVKDENAILIISAVGYVTQEISIKNNDYSNIVLSSNPDNMDEVVVVGYGTQKRANLTGAVSSITNKDLTRVPVSNTTNALVGRLAGLIAVQSNGMPGQDVSDLRIRGFQGALVIVDGVETDFRFLDPNQIESISILKDAAASIYGARAGNGVILVTTKRGETSKPTLGINSSYTLQGIGAMPKPVNSGQYAELRREAYLNAGGPEANAPFTQEQIQKYYDGKDPAYPNTDWYNFLIRKWAPQHQHNVSLSGGTSKLKYYGMLGYLDQETVFKNNGGDYKRYNFQSNIDAEIFDNLSLQLTLNSVFDDRNYTVRNMYGGQGSIWYDLWFTLPIYPSAFPDPTKIPWAGGGTGGAYAVSNQSLSGYNRTLNQSHRGSISLKYDFKFVPGLSFKAMSTYATNTGFNKLFEIPATLYTYDRVTDQYQFKTTYPTPQSRLTQRSDRSRMINTQLSLNYNKIIKEKHNVSAVVLQEVHDTKGDWYSAFRGGFITTMVDQLFAGSTVGLSNDGSGWEDGRASYVGRLNYAFDDKYLVEGILRADASGRFPQENRWGYFPGISIGWRIDRENFMKTASQVVNNLKLRLSYGEAGNDAIGRFQFLSAYATNSLPYILGNQPMAAIYPTGLANPNITWEKMRTYNAGLDFSLFNRKLYGEADVFYRERVDILTPRYATVPSSFGAVLPPENLNSDNTRGFDLMIGTAHNFGNFRLDVKTTLSWSRSKWKHFEEPDFGLDSNQDRLYRQSGNWQDRVIGYINGGLFTSEEQISNLGYTYPNGNSNLRMGDIIYKDLNSDGVLDWKDQQVIGKGIVPHWIAGFNVNASYKNFDLSFLFQGAFGFYYELYYPKVDADVNIPDYVFSDRWSPGNNRSDALIPRLNGAPTNYNMRSDYTFKKADYLRLKNFSLGYTIPKQILERYKIGQLRFYVAGINLLTFSGLNKFHIDPEAPSSQGGQYYPQQKNISFGLNLSL